MNMRDELLEDAKKAARAVSHTDDCELFSEFVPDDAKVCDCRRHDRSVVSALDALIERLMDPDEGMLIAACVAEAGSIGIDWNSLPERDREHSKHQTRTAIIGAISTLKLKEQNDE